MVCQSSEHNSRNSVVVILRNKRNAGEPLRENALGRDNHLTIFISIFTRQIDNNVTFFFLYIYVLIHTDGRFNLGFSDIQIIILYIQIDIFERNFADFCLTFAGSIIEYSIFQANRTHNLT